MKVTAWLVAATLALMLVLTGCAEKQGDDGKTGPAGTPGADGSDGAPGVTKSIIQRSLSFEVLSATVPADYKPVVTFRLLDQDGFQFANLSLGSTTSANLRVTIAQLDTTTVPQSPSWKNYLTSRQSKSSTNLGNWGGNWGTATSRCSVQGTTEGSSAFPAASGALTYNSATGVYTYTFNKAIGPAAVTPATDCSPASGYSVTHSASATHRVGMELRNLTNAEGEPLGADATYDFIPAGGTPATREIVATSTCNGACHGKLEAHGEARFSVGYCVVCHNPDMRDPNGGDVFDVAKGNPLDFKVMVHRLHYGSNLPSQIDGGEAYKIWGFNDSEINFGNGTLPVMTTSRSTSSDQLYMRTTAGSGGGFFPDCTKCHTGSTGVAQESNWKDNPTIESCTSCHNNIYFGATAPSATVGLASMSPSDWQQHGGFGAAGALTNSSTCAGCHGSSGTSAHVDAAHAYPVNIRTEADRWTYKITGVNYNSTSGALAVTYRIDDGTTTGVDYRSLNATTNVTTGAEFGTPYGGTSPAGSINIKVAWPAWEYANNGQNSAAMLAAGMAGQSAPGSAMSQAVVNTPTVSTNAPTPNGACPGSTCTFTKTLTLPASAVNAWASSNKVTLAVYLDGHPLGRVQAGSGNASIISGHTQAEPRWRNVPAQSLITYWEVASNATGAGTAITPSSSNEDLVRRTAVLTANCANCHTTLSLHGNNRSDDTQVCVTCHNANNSDLPNRTASNSQDGLLEQSVDMKVMIHGIHAGGKKSWVTTSATYGGFRDKGMIIAGTDFSAVAFPNRLSNCTVCHATDAYQLPLASVVNPVSWKSVPAAANLWEAQRHAFAVADVNSTSDIITIASQAYSNTTATPSSFGVTFYAAAGATLPAPLVAGNTYFVVNSSGNTIQIHDGSSVVNFTDSGTGTGSAFSILPVNYTQGSDDHNMSPVSAVCTACHDNALAKAHVLSTGLGVLDKDSSAAATTMTDAIYDASYTNGYGEGFEVCALCHAAGKIADVKKVHRVGIP